MPGFARPKATQRKRSKMNDQTVRFALATVMLWIRFGACGWAEVGGISLTTPAGLVYGDKFRVAFITDYFMSASSSNIADYNNVDEAAAPREGGAVWVVRSRRIASSKRLFSSTSP
jgi:hypothetical protein